MKVQAKNYVPKNRRVLVLAPPKETKIGGVYIPEQSQVRPNNGKIVGIDPTLVSLKVGDNVLYHKGIGLQICLNGVDHLLLHENEILLTYDEEEVTS